MLNLHISGLCYERGNTAQVAVERSFRIEYHCEVPRGHQQSHWCNQCQNWKQYHYLERIDELMYSGLLMELIRG